MKAKIIFLMVDRSERTFDVEGTNQGEFYDAGVAQLGESTVLIENWRTEVENGEPGQDKSDGVAARSPLQKVRFDLLPVAPLVQVARVFTFGAYHYGDRNWEAGFSWSRCLGAIWRHLTKWCLGQDNDEESGINHLAHVVANCLFLLEYAMTGKGTDDRKKTPAKTVTKLFTPLSIERE